PPPATGASHRPGQRIRWPTTHRTGRRQRCERGIAQTPAQRRACRNPGPRVGIRVGMTIQPHILVVDDDPQIRALLEDYLTQNALRVTVAANGQQMSSLLAEEAIDLVVLDLRLAGEDGMAIARSLRDQSAIPIVMLTGVRDEADRVMGLELGADDYITKPFSPRELLARIRTVLRRTKSASSASPRQREVRAYRFGAFELNLRTRRLKQRSGGHVVLTN